MYKKAGIIVAGVLILVAVIVVLIATGGGSEKESKPKKVQETTTVVTEAEVQTEVGTEQAPAQEVNSAVLPIDADTLPTPKSTEQLGYVQSKTVALIDGQLYYTLSMLIGSENMQLTYIVSKSGYESADIGMKVKVGVDCYVTDSGAAYYLVTGVSPAE